MLAEAPAVHLAMVHHPGDNRGRESRTDTGNKGRVLAGGEPSAACKSVC